jgi:hypothetical protein
MVFTRIIPIIEYYPLLFFRDALTSRFHWIHDIDHNIFSRNGRDFNTDWSIGNIPHYRLLLLSRAPVLISNQLSIFINNSCYNFTNVHFRGIPQNSQTSIRTVHSVMTQQQSSKSVSNPRSCSCSVVRYMFINSHYINAVINHHADFWLLNETGVEVNPLWALIKC